MEKKQMHPDAVSRITEWMFSDDTGVSSETMASIALGIKKKDVFGYSAPYDGCDFGRCYRLVKIVPEIREAFPAIATKVPAFAGILAQWDALCLLYESGLPDEWNTRLNAKLDALRQAEFA